MPDELAAGPLVLRRWRIEMLDELMEAIEESWDALAPWMPWAVTLPTVEDEREFLAAAPERFAAGIEFGYGMRHGDTARFLGGCGLHAHRHPELEIGYWVRASETGQGYATAAAQALTDAGFEHVTGVERIQIRCGEGNGASAAIPPKLGYSLDRVEGGLMFWNKNRSPLV